ncbi:MAG: AraC family transcriptional regulator [Rubrobacteraceae bacterium]|nr:AraC family transcriptional regulator [Rubrobacteraceae bacterium]
MQRLRLGSGLPVRAQNAGLFVSRGRGVHPDRVLSSYELIFVREGALSIFEEERLFEVGAGQSLVLWPGRRHYGAAPYPPDLSFYWIHFEVCEAGVGDGGLEVPQHATVGRPNHLAELFRRFLDDQESRWLDSVRAALLLMLMLCEVSGAGPSTRTTDGNTTLLACRADSYIRTHFHDPALSTSTVARELGYNPDYLGRAYRAVYGQTMTEAIHWRRMRHARRMLIESDHNVEEIARECGFKDARYFRRIFRRYEGMNPLAFRRLYAQVHVNTG